MGVGSEAIGLAGAMCARTNDVYAAFWNPAGLAEMDDNEVATSRMANAAVLGNNFLGIAFGNERLSFGGMKSRFALAWVPRMHIKASGAYDKNDIESVFLRFALPGLSDTFDGDIETKTKDVRFSWAITPKQDPRWSFAVTVARVDCATAFCGVTADDPGNYHVASTGASAWAVNLGGKYYFSDEWTFAAALRDVDTTLDVETNTYYQDGTQTHEIFQTDFPRDLSIGAWWRYSPDLNFSFDYQALYGDYGNYKLNFQNLRVGGEVVREHMRYRGGLLIPLVLKADELANLRGKLPVPFAPTVGLGWRGKSLVFDVALYAQPIMTYQRQSLYPGLDLTLGWFF